MRQYFFIAPSKTFTKSAKRARNEGRKKPNDPIARPKNPSPASIDLFLSEEESSPLPQPEKPPEPPKFLSSAEADILLSSLPKLHIDVDPKQSCVDLRKAVVHVSGVTISDLQKDYEIIYEDDWIPQEHGSEKVDYDDADVLSDWPEEDGEIGDVGPEYAEVEKILAADVKVKIFETKKIEF